MSALPVLHLGSTGHYVQLLQMDLDGLAQNYNGFAIDGVYGESTQDVVKNLEDRFELNRDGVVGPLTWKILIEHVKSIQTALHHYGFYKGTVDGWYGASTQAAVLAFQKSRGLAQTGIVDPRTRQAMFNPNDRDHYQDRPTSSSLDSLDPHVAAMARRFLELTRQHGMDVRIYTAFRSWADEDRLFAQGRTAPGPKVTNARGGDSYHNWGLAFDAAPYEHGKKSTDIAKFKEMGKLGKQAGLQWGGDFKSLVDYPHFQYTYGLNTWDLLNGARPRG